MVVTVKSLTVTVDKLRRWRCQSPSPSIVVSVTVESLIAGW